MHKWVRPHGPEVALHPGHAKEWDKGERDEIEQSWLSRLENLAGDGGSEESEEVPEEGAVEVGDPKPVRGKRDSVLGQTRSLCPLVGVVAHDEAEKEAGHDDVSESEHGEVARGVGGGEDELAGEGETRC